mgnify:FL=1
METKPGVVVVTKFCKSKSQAFMKYVDYMNREEAVRLENESQFNLYTDYMGNSEKTTGLFTKQKDMLSKEERDALKKGFEMAQKNGSLMWQTVISFDNWWLDENGIYSHDTGKLDEKKLKEVTRNAVTKMLEKENLENGLWSAAIHYNTDNIHIHVATVEPVPMRKKKEYVQYKTVEKDGKLVKQPILDGNGKPIVKEEYVGRFKQKSIETCKSAIVNQIMQEQDINRNINRIIRNNILDGKKNNPLLHDPLFRKNLMKLYKKLPDVDRKMWNYNSSIMKPYQEELDQLTDQYLETYHKDDFEQFKKDIEKQNENYSRAYGGDPSKMHYADNKMKDLYTRMGNSILKELREFDKQQKNLIIEEAVGKRKMSDRSMGSRTGWLWSRTLRSLKKSMDKDWQQIQNEREYEALQERSMDEVER